ncbi:protein late bloomer-like isoform X1 [Bactrocera tryoni]|uniref:protein late bloomer-like isoform X1 n=2 Tax=Bactrocera tryoni TaxID=59916 RepID=UPI001A9644E8|nr:protein late bloomer-like isoform X1 [Bactrocera tryoni]
MALKISLLKAVLAVVNTVLPLLGIGLIALSVYELNTSTPGTMQHISIVIQIFIGSFVVLTSFLGCFGLCRESLGLTWSYVICMLILVIFQIYLITVAGVTDYVQNTTDHLDQLWSNVTLNAAEIAQVEQQYECCGRLGKADYIKLDKRIPRNCYRNFSGTESDLYTESCLTVLQEMARKSGSTGLAIKLTLFGFEVLALFFSGLMGITIRHKRRRDQFVDN